MNKKPITIRFGLSDLVYRLIMRMDKQVERYSYETAPYCGHHYSGHNGRYTESEYHEGEGFWRVKSKYFFLGGDTEGTGTYFHCPLLRLGRLITTGAYPGRYQKPSRRVFDLAIGSGFTVLPWWRWVIYEHPVSGWLFSKRLDISFLFFHIKYIRRHGD